LQAAACSKQERDTKKLHTERKYGTFDSCSSKKQYTVVQLVWTIVLAKKGILKFAICLTMRFFLTEIIICSFNNNALEKCANGKAFYIVTFNQH